MSERHNFSLMLYTPYGLYLTRSLSQAKISTFKEKLKKHLLCKQALGDGSNWIETNFVN